MKSCFTGACLMCGIACAHFGDVSPAEIIVVGIGVAAIPNEIGVTQTKDSLHYRFGWDWQIPLHDIGNPGPKSKLPLMISNINSKWSFGAGYRLSLKYLDLGANANYYDQQWNFSPEVGLKLCVDQKEGIACTHLLYQVSSRPQHSLKLLFSLY